MPTICTSCRSRARKDSKEAGTYYRVVATLPAEQVWTTKAESKCALWK